MSLLTSHIHLRYCRIDHYDHSYRNRNNDHHDHDGHHDYDGHHVMMIIKIMMISTTS